MAACQDLRMDGEAGTAARVGTWFALRGANPALLLAEAAQAAGITAYSPVLVDCDDETRTQRLHLERRQPELANKDMMNWANYLRRSAKKRGWDILDTSGVGLEQCVAYVMARLRSTSSR